MGKVDIEWLNRLSLKDVSLNDQNKQKLFQADHISAGFNLWPLLRGRWVFTTVRLFGCSIKLQRETPDSPLNMQFLIDAFASKDTTSKTPIDLRIKTILIRRSKFSYDITGERHNPDKFDAKHIQVNNINGNIAPVSFKKNNFAVQIRKLSLEEQSGFKLTNLSANIKGNQDNIRVQDLKIRLPQTQLHIAKASIRKNNKDNLAHPLTQAPIEIQIEPSQIGFRDFSALIPVFKNISEPILFSASASGTISNISINNLTISQNRSLSLTARMNLKGLLQPEEEVYLFGEVGNLRVTKDGLNRIINELSSFPPSISETINKLGTLNFSGEISGFIDHLVAFGKLSTEIGSLEMDMLIGQKKDENIATYLKGKIASSNLDIQKLFAENNPYGTTRFSAELDMSRPVNGLFSGIIHAQIDELEYKKHMYKNILLSGNFRPKEFRGTIDINDPNGKFHAEGAINTNKTEAALNISALMEDVRLDKLYLTDKYADPKLSFKLNSNITGNNIDDFQGYIAIEDLAFLTRTDSFFLDTMRVDAYGDISNRLLTVSSDILNGEISGAFSLSEIFSYIISTSRSYLPSLNEVYQDFSSKEEERFSYKISVENTEKLSNTLKLPVTILKPSNISGYCNNESGNVFLTASMPRFNIGSSAFEKGSIVLNNFNGSIKMEVKADQLQKENSFNHINIQADAANDEIKTSFSLENPNKGGLKIAVSSSTRFTTKEKKGYKSLVTKINIEPNKLIVNDSTWHIKPASIVIDNENISVKDLYISKEDQYLHINGNISANQPQETLLLDLNDIELSYIFDIVNIPALQFGGRATGTVRLNDLYGSRIINTDLEVRNFSFNQVVQGRLNLFSEWDNDQQGILLLGSIYKDNATWTDVNGYIYPAGEKEGLSLYFDATDLDLGLLRPYFQAFTNTFEGSGFGKIHLFGPFSNLSFEGKAMIRNGRIGVDFLNTSYTFSDSIFLTPTTIEGRNITIQDKHGNKGSVNFAVRHKYLENFNFQVDVKAENMLLYDVPEKRNSNIYGSVYGTGNAHLKGNEQLINIDANISSNKNTMVGFNFTDGPSAEEYDFIRFKNKQKTDKPTDESSSQEEDGTEIRINILADVTPNAKFELIMDPTTGDKIKCNGNGNLQVQYGSSSNMAMYGAYTIQEGSYNFSLQQLLHKDFKIREGSRIDFRGDPMDAHLNMNASYYLRANIEDLDERFVQERGIQRSIPVNCLLKLNGRLQNPGISFDMEFPNSTNELARQVRSFIDTEDMMTRQIIYLLVLNRFYTPNYSTNDYRSNELSLIASSALSTQLSGLLNSLTDKVQIETNIRSRQDGITDTEMEMLLSSQLLNNRLIFNGSFGYRDNYIQNNAFVGEFDLEYKLTPSGEIRLKAYSHANDMYYRYNLKSQTRQGVGIMFHKDFSRFSDIFRRRKRMFLEKEKTVK